MAQSIVVLQPEDKREALRRLIKSEDVKNALIFCNRKRDVDILYKSLVRHGFDAAALHGDMPQSKRTETLERFKNDEIRLLVCSDVAARGLDIQGLTHVFCFDVPYHAEDYVHRIGRTGRAGRDGRSFTLAAPEDGKSVAAIQKLIGARHPGGNDPGDRDRRTRFRGRTRPRTPSRARPYREADAKASRGCAASGAQGCTEGNSARDAANRLEERQRHTVSETRSPPLAARRARPR